MSTARCPSSRHAAQAVGTLRSAVALCDHAHGHGVQLEGGFKNCTVMPIEQTVHSQPYV